MPKGVTIDFNADVAKYTSGIDRAIGDLNKFQSNADRVANKLKNTLKVLAAPLVGAGLVSTLNSMSEAVDRVTKELDNTGKTARRLGLLTDQLQEIRIQAEAAGIETGVLDIAFQRFARRVGSGSLDKTFKELDISIRDSSGNLKTNYDLWNEFGQKVSGVTDENRQLALAMAAVDTEGVKLVELWRSSASSIDDVKRKIEEYGLIYDENLIRKAEAYQTELGLVKRAQKALEDLTVAGLTEQAMQWEKVKLKISQAKFELLRYFGVFGVTQGTDKEQAVKLISEQQQLQEQMLTLRKKYYAATNEEEMKKIERNMRFNRVMRDRNESRRKELLEKFEKGLPTTFTGDGNAGTDYAPAAKTRKIAAPKTKKVKEEKDPVDAWIDSIHAYKQEIELINPKLERFGKLFAEGAFGDPASLQAQQVYIEGVKRLGFETDSTFEKIEDKVKDINDAWQELGATFSSAFEDAIVNGAKLSDVLDGLEKDIVRIITRNLVTKPLEGKIAAAFSNGGGISDLFGGLFGDIFGSGKASGGPVYPGKIYPVGEEGVELFAPKTAGTIIPNHQLGGATIVVNINAPAGSNPEAYRLSARQGALEGSRLLGRSRSIS